MTDVSTILGIALIGVGAASAVYGAILCYTTKVGLKRCIFRIRNGSRLDVGGKLVTQVRPKLHCLWKLN